MSILKPAGKLNHKQEHSGMAFKKLALVALAALLALTAAGCGTDPFRLHIIANSDSEEDQSVKLAVRDEILKLSADGMKKVSSKEEAEEYIRKNLQIIEEKAQEVLDEKDFPYKAKAYLGRFEFPEKTYGNTTYPAGEYEALRIVLGKGEGKNWWCVMFPPLCLQDLPEEQLKKLMENKDEIKVEYTSFFKELFDGMFGGDK
jgi:stage II sporulation protein R